MEPKKILQKLLQMVREEKNLNMITLRYFDLR